MLQRAARLLSEVSGALVFPSPHAELFSAELLISDGASRKSVSEVASYPQRWLLADFSRLHSITLHKKHALDAHDLPFPE